MPHPCSSLQSTSEVRQVLSLALCYPTCTHPQKSVKGQCMAGPEAEEASCLRQMSGAFRRVPSPLHGTSHRMRSKRSCLPCGGARLDQDLSDQDLSTNILTSDLPVGIAGDAICRPSCSSAANTEDIVITPDAGRKNFYATISTCVPKLHAMQIRLPMLG